MTVGDGSFGTRGLGHLCGSPSWPSVLAAGVYDDSAVPTLLGGPLWTTVDLEPDDGWSETAELNLRDAVLTSVYTHHRTGAVVTSTRFASPVRRGVVALRVEGPSDQVAESPVLRAPPPRPGAVADAVEPADDVSTDTDELRDVVHDRRHRRRRPPEGGRHPRASMPDPGRRVSSRAVGCTTGAGDGTLDPRGRMGPRLRGSARGAPFDLAAGGGSRRRPTSAAAPTSTVP